MARFGYGERKLLETLAGMWTAILQLRRPCMCLLEAFFDQIQLHDYGEPFALPSELIAECWTLTSLAPLFCSGLRAAVHPELALVDASDAMEAEVVTTVGQKLAEELARQRLTRAAWAKLLSPLQALRRLHGDSLPEDEVPEEEEPARSHPLWTGVIQSSHFKLVRKRRIKRRVHINVSELKAAVDSLKRRCPLRPSCRHLLASDSQVVLGCLVRGRSSSKNLNHLLRTLLPTLLSCDGYICAQYVPTGINVADDPTRARACRKPTCCEEEWISAISAGDCSGLDDKLQQVGISDFQVARLPRQEPVVAAPVSPTSERDRARKEYWRTRVAGKIGTKFKSPPSAVSFSPWLPRVRCPPAALKLLLTLPESQFVFPPGVDRAQCLRYKGHLDLFSGSRASARALAAESGQWVLTYDIKHSPDEDLLSGPVQESLEAMVRAGCFLSAAGGPVCSSFSRAIRAGAGQSTPWRIGRDITEHAG